MSRRSVGRSSCVVLLSSAVVLVGCITESEFPEVATFRIVSAEPVRLITSVSFNSVFDCVAPLPCILSDSVVFITSDTIHIAGSAQGTLVLAIPSRLFIRATSLSDANVLSMRVSVEGDVKYDYGLRLGAGEWLQYAACFASLDFPVQVHPTDPLIGCPVM